MPVLQLPFDGGLDVNTYPDLVDPSAYTSIQHAVSTQDKALSKPFGTARQPAAPVTLARVGAAVSELVGSDGQALYGLGPAAWASRGMLPEATPKRVQLLNGGYTGFAQQQMAVTTDGRSVVVSIDSTGDPITGTATYTANVRVYNGRTLLTTVALGVSVTSPTPPLRVAIFGTTYAILFVAGSVYQLSLSTYAVSLIETITGYYTGAIELLTSAYSAPVLLYTNNSGSTLFLHRYALGASPSVAATGSVAVSTPIHFAALVIAGAIIVSALPSGGSTATVYHIDSTALTLISTQSVVTFTGANTIGSGWTTDIVSPNGSDAGIVYVFPNSGTITTFAWFQAFVATATSGATFVAAGGGGSGVQVSHQESRVFAVNGRAYMAIRAGQASQLADVTALATVNSFRPVAAWSPRLSDAHVQPVQISVSGQVATLGWRTLTSSLAGSLTSSFGIVTLTFGTGLPSCSPYGLSALIGGGVPTAYDGNAATELGFFTEPQGTSYSAGTGTGYTGTISVCCCWAWVNGRGEIERSAPSQPGQISPANIATINCNYVPLAITSRKNVILEFYRTINGGQTYYFAGSVQPSGPSGFVQTYSLALGTDANLSTHALLYSQPGSAGTNLARFAPPSLVSLFPFQDRAFGLAEDGQTIWYSGQYVSGELPWWQDQFTLTVPVRSSDVIALAGQNGNLYAFRRSGIVMFTGFGPPDNGQGGSFSDPVELPTEVGCIEPRSIVATSMGIFFQSPRGIELLDTGNNVVWIGKPVDGLLQAFPIITSALVSEIDKRVIFTCILAGTNVHTGLSLVFDLVQGMWTSTNVQDARNAGAGVASACLLSTTSSGSQAVRAFLSTGGYVYEEDRTTYLQEGVYQGTTIVPGSVKVAGLQGYMRARVVQVKASAQSPHDLVVSVATNGSATYRQVHTFTWSQIQALPEGDHLRFTIVDQKCSSIRVMIQDIAPSNGAPLGSGQGPIFVSWALDVMTKDGLAKLPKGAR